jgi:hypothetical protein
MGLAVQTVSLQGPMVKWGFFLICSLWVTPLPVGAYPSHDQIINKQMLDNIKSNIHYTEKILKGSQIKNESHLWEV